MQLFWINTLTGLFPLTWRFKIRRCSAGGGNRCGSAASPGSSSRSARSTSSSTAANFFIQLLQSAVSSTASRTCSTSSTRTRPSWNGWDEPELLVVLDPAPARRRDPDDDPAEHAVAEGGGATQARLRAVTKPEDLQVPARVRNVQISAAVDVTAGAAVLGYGALRARDECRRRRRAPSPGCSCSMHHDLPLPARDRDLGALDRQRLGDHRAIRRHLPGRALADLDLSDPAALAFRLLIFPARGSTSRRGG